MVADTSMHSYKKQQEKSDQLPEEGLLHRRQEIVAYLGAAW